MVRSLVLASASPRRRALLEERGIRFRVLASNVDEHFDGSVGAAAAAASLALQKAQAVAGEVPDAFVLGADTVVVLGSDGPDLLQLGKPASVQEAQETLEALSGTTHRVITGMAVIAPGGQSYTDSETTQVSMRTWTPAEIAAYVESDEWRDKAGGYAIQESADRFVEGLSGGGFDNVVGLPVERALRLLAQAGWATSE